MELVFRTEYFRAVSPNLDVWLDVYMFIERRITETKVPYLLQAPQIHG